VVLYDQLGCGESTHLREKGADFWTIELFLEELESLVQTLGIEEYDVIGHSWGSILAAEHAVLKPKGLRKLVFTDSLPSMPLWMESTRAQIAELPQEAREAIERCEREGKLDAPEYQQAVGLYYSKHLCTIQPWPVELSTSFANVMQDPTVPTAMLGAAAFEVSGTLKDWSVIPRLPQISVPTLVMWGKDDQASDLVQAPYLEKIGDVSKKRWEASSHVPWLEEREAYLEYLGKWLTE